MQVPDTSGTRHTHRVDVAESLRCAALDKTDQARRHKKEMLRYLVLVAALVAVVLLISIALYYTQGNSVMIEHLSSL